MALQLCTFCHKLVKKRKLDLRNRLFLAGCVSQPGILEAIIYLFGCKGKRRKFQRCILAITLFDRWPTSIKEHCLQHFFSTLQSATICWKRPAKKLVSFIMLSSITPSPIVITNVFTQVFRKHSQIFKNHSQTFKSHSQILI